MTFAETTPPILHNEGTVIKVPHRLHHKQSCTTLDSYTRATRRRHRVLAEAVSNRIRGSASLPLRPSNLGPCGTFFSMNSATSKAPEHTATTELPRVWTLPRAAITSSKAELRMASLTYGLDLIFGTEGRASCSLTI